MRFLLLLICLCLIAAACGGDDLAASPTQDPPTTPLLERPCDRIGYPCDWREADPAVLDRSLDLLEEGARLLEAGDSPIEVARYLETLDGVVATNWADGGVVFRLQGGLPVTVLTDAVTEVDASTQGTQPGVLVGGSPAVGADAVLASFHTVSDVQLQVDRSSSYETSREPDIRPRDVMVLSPTRSVDRSAAIDAAIDSGLQPPTDPATATRDAFQNSDHFDVLDLPDSSAVPQHWANMANFDVVVIETHGAFYPDDGSGDVTGLFLAGPPADPYLLDLGMTADEAKYQDHGGWTVAWVAAARAYHISFSDDFFFGLPGSGVGKTIVLLNACKMGAEVVSTTSLASTIAGSRGAVFYWDTGVPRISSDATTAYLAELLIDGADAATAMAQMRLDGEHTATYRGLVTTLDVYQESGSVRARDAVGTYVDGTLAESGATISARGRPGDGTEDQIERVEIRIDAVVPGSEHATTVVVTVDGEPLRLMQNGSEVEELVLSEDTIDPARSDEARGSWRHHRIDLEGAGLPFDLSEEDVTQGRGHVWEVTVRGETGGPTVHRIDPVIFRLGTVRVLSPVNSLTLEADDEVYLDGRAGDGNNEDFPLFLRVEHLDESVDASVYTVAVSIGQNRFEFGLEEFESHGDGVFALERTVSIDPLDELRTPAVLFASLTREDDSGVDTVDEFSADAVILVLELPTGCDYLTGRQMSDAMGRSFGNGEELSVFGSGDLCRWSSVWSTVEITLGGSDQVRQLRSAVAQNDPAAVDGFNDAAIYDLVSGNALNPSGIETQGGAIQYNNFVNLFVVIDDATAATIRVQGNVVVEEGPESGLLRRLKALVAALRQAL